MKKSIMSTKFCAARRKGVTSYHLVAIGVDGKFYMHRKEWSHWGSKAASNFDHKVRSASVIDLDHWDLVTCDAQRIPTTWR